MPEPRWDVRKAAQEMIRRGDYGLSARGFYASDIDRRGALDTAERELMATFNVRRETARSALGWALAQESGEQYRPGRTPGRTSGTSPNFHAVFPPDVLAILLALPVGWRTAYVVAAVRHWAEQEPLPQNGAEVAALLKK